MAGLRAKQKADKNRRILESATALFRDQGYDSARIEDIAEKRLDMQVPDDKRIQVVTPTGTTP